MNQMILSNLRNRPVRTLVSILAVAIEVTLILLIVGLTNGMVQDYAKRVQGVGADLLVRPESTSMFITLSGNTLPLKLADLLRQQPGVKAVAPVAVQSNNTSLDAVDGIDAASFYAVSGGFIFQEGRIFRAPDEVIVDDLFARNHHVHVGQKIPLLGHQFTISGIFEHGKGARIYVDLQGLDNLIGSPGKAAMMYVKLTEPGQAQAQINQLKRLLRGYSIIPMAEWLQNFTSTNVPMLPVFQKTLIGVAVLIGLLVIFLSMYTTILERTREIGILKALGASRAYIVQAILRETVVLAIAGIIAGTLIAYGLRAVLIDAIPTLPIAASAAWDLRAAAIAIAGGLVGALYPAAKAAAQDPIAALAYE